MKNQILISILFLFLNSTSYSQCGVNAKIELTGTGPNLVLTALNPSILPNWSAYNFEWEMDNSVISNLSSTAANFPTNMHHQVCLTAYGTDTITGDSCMNKHCNIYRCDSYGAFFAFVQIGTIQNTGNKIVFNLTYYNSWIPPTLVVTFSDGTDTTVTLPATITHTFPNPGLKQIHIESTGFPVLPSYLNALVHVNDGNTNFNSINYGYNVLSGDSVLFNITSNPPCNSASCMDLTNYFLYATAQNGVPALYKSPIPGYMATVIQVNDSNGGYIQQYKDFIVNDWNIIPDTIGGTVWDDADADGFFDSTELGIPNKQVTCGMYYANTDSAGQYKILVPHVQESLGLANTNIYSYTTDNYLTFNFPGTNNLHTNFNFGVAKLVTALNGKVYIDYNNDSIWSTGDVTVPNVTIVAHDTVNGKNYATVTNALGNYTLPLPLGYFILKATQSALDSVTTIPDSIILNNPSGTINNLDFGLNTNGQDLGIYMNSSNQARPGFIYKLNSFVTNHRTDTSRANVIITYDPSLVYSGSQPAGGLHNTTNHTVSWMTGKIAPGQTSIFNIDLMVPVTLPLGTGLNLSGSISPFVGYSDLISTNNFYSFSDTVVGSFDPNDKLVSPNGYIKGNERLHYRINFQNTGTASAINVFVKDVIDSSLDMNSFMMERASHGYILIINDHKLSWRFSNINLPDSNANEALSHGFVEYSIMPNSGLPDGTTISNSANIFFDFNSPVSTNTTMNQVDLFLGRNEIKENHFIKLLPNPATINLDIQFKNDFEDKVELSIIDVAGKTLYSTNSNSDKIRIPVNFLVDGMYLVKIVGARNNYIGKFIKQ